MALSNDSAKAVARDVTAASAGFVEGLPTARAQAQKSRSSPRALIVAVAVAAAAAAGARYYLHERQFEDTDDAQVDCVISALGPRVAGTVKAVYVRENQVVEQGQLLGELDPIDFQLSLDAAKANEAQARATLEAESPSVSMAQSSNEAAQTVASASLASSFSALTAAENEVKQLAAQLARDEANLQLVQVERDRSATLFKTGATARADLDSHTTAFDVAIEQAAAEREGLAAAQARVAQRRASIEEARAHVAEVRSNGPRVVAGRDATVASRQSSYELAQVQVRQAAQALQYTRIVAPAAGVIAKKGIAVGDYVVPGQQLFALAQTGETWVTAYFRETQLRRIAPGQPVEVHVDALELDFHGTVESLGGATGSRVSLLPPENASGNYVKVVQRLPVRIQFDPTQPGLERLRPGMSVIPTVRIP